MRTASGGESDHEEPCGGPHAGSRGGISGVGASPAECAGFRGWTCACCGITAQISRSGELKECAACRAVRYCGKACQKEDWPAHKATCKRLQAAEG
jgi:hypothetical protein